MYTSSKKKEKKESNAKDLGKIRIFARPVVWKLSTL